MSLTHGKKKRTITTIKPILANPIKNAAISHKLYGMKRKKLAVQWQPVQINHKYGLVITHREEIILVSGLINAFEDRSYRLRNHLSNEHGI